MSRLLFEKLKTDWQFRRKLLLCISFLVNLAYAFFLFIVSQLYQSRWFFVMAFYYALLSLTRIFVYLQMNPQKPTISKIKTMRVCGYFLLVINVVVAAMMFLLIYGNRVVRHHEITVITLATYTFGSLTMAIIGSVRSVKKDDHVYVSAKVISLISASVSLVTLTNTMLSTFGDDGSLRRIMLPLLSGAVALFIIIGALWMIRKANLDLRIYKDE